MKETLFVCLVEGNRSSYAAIMEIFVMLKHRQSIFLHLLPQRFGQTMTVRAAFILIEST
jgi:hypothetical protein